jgi:cyclase
MRTKRLIPTLLLQRGGLVKTKKFLHPKYVGDPLNAIRIFNEKEVDELILLDIAASKENVEPDYKLIGKIAGECFMPLTYGGGIASLDQAEKIFSLGIEKISLQTSAFKDPFFITRLADRFGTQAIVLSIDVKRNWCNQPVLFCAQRTKAFSSASWLSVAQNLVAAGAGEVLLNSVDRDGTLAGPDVDLIEQAATALPVPLIALGGVASLSDIKVVMEAGASAVAAGAFFVFHGPHRAVLISYPCHRELEALFMSERPGNESMSPAKK